MPTTFSTVQLICEKFGIKSNNFDHANKLFRTEIVGKLVNIIVPSEIDKNECINITGRVTGYGVGCIRIDGLYLPVDDIKTVELIKETDISPFVSLKPFDERNDS